MRGPSGAWIQATNLVFVQHSDVFFSMKLELPELDSLRSKSDDFHFDNNNQIRRKLSISLLFDHIDSNNPRFQQSTILDNWN